MWGVAVVLLGGVALGQFKPTTYRPEARAVFGQCKAQADGTLGRSYQCPGLNASIAFLELPATEPEEKILELMRGGLAASVQGELETNPTSLMLAGSERTALALTIRAPKGGKAQAVGHVTVAKVDGGFWSYLCLADASRRPAIKDCQRVLEFFAAHGVPEPIDLRARKPLEKPLLGTRELVVPEGCSFSAPRVELGRIQCASSFFTWSQLPPEVDLAKWRSENTAMLAKQLQQQVASQGAVLKESQVDCRVMGQPERCFQLSAPVGKARFRALHGVTRVDRQGFQLVCVQSDTSEAPPPVCNDLLELVSAVAPDAGTPDASAK